MKTKTATTIREMNLKDIPFLMSLIKEAGWNQIKSDWSRYMSYNPQGCFIAEYNGVPAGSATTLTYQDKIGWIGMVIVPQSFRGKGIATALLQHCISFLKVKVRVIKLDATPMGKSVYEKLGFKTEYPISRMIGQGALFELDTSIENMNSCLDQTLNLDKLAFGVSREKVIRTLANEYANYALCSFKKNKTTGYIMANAGREAWHIGPWVAEDEATAKTLLKSLLSKLENKEIIMDIPHINEAALNICQALGFIEQRPLIRMYYGENKWPGQTDLLYATARPEKG